jgi:hypothetical protein
LDIFCALPSPLRQISPKMVAWRQRNQGLH